jgi:hypothetical protein
METQASQRTPSMEQGHQQQISERLSETSQDMFLFGAAISVAASLLLRVLGRQHDALFVGQWAPTLLALGLYSQRYPESVPRRTSTFSEQNPPVH